MVKNNYLQSLVSEKNADRSRIVGIRFSTDSFVALHGIGQTRFDRKKIRSKRSRTHERSKTNFFFSFLSNSFLNSFFFLLPNTIVQHFSSLIDGTILFILLIFRFLSTTAVSPFYVLSIIKKKKRNDLDYNFSN